MNKTIIETQGVEATTFDKTLKAAGLNWEARSDKVAGMDTGIQMPRKKLLYRSDDSTPLGIVGIDYEPSNPQAFLKAQFNFAEFVKGEVSRVGFIKDRSRAFAFVKLGDRLVIPRKERKVGDPLQAYIYSTDGWDGGTPHRARLFIERLRCANGMTSREIKASLWVSHTKNMGERYEPRWQTFLGEATKTIDAVRKEFTQLAKTHLSADKAKEYLAKLIPGDNERSQNRRVKILDLFHNGEGNEGSTAWDLYNAVTEFVTHHRTYRKTDSTSLETNRFLGVLETDTMSRQALNLLLN